MKKFNQKQFSVEILYFAIFTTATLLAWIGFEVYRKLTIQPEISLVNQEELEPLNSELDMKTLNMVRNRLHISQQVLDALVVTKVIENNNETVAVETELIQEATASGEI